MTERAKSADEYLWQEHKLFSFGKKKKKKILLLLFIFLLLSTVCPGTGQKVHKPPQKNVFPTAGLSLGCHSSAAQDTHIHILF